MSNDPASANKSPAENKTKESATIREPSRGSLVVIFLTVFIDLLGFGIVLPLLPLYAKSFSTDEAGWTIALLMSSYSIMQFLFAPFWGRLSDRVGRRPILMIGLAGSFVFYGLFGVASLYESLVLLFVSRIGAGIAGATISTAHAYIADTTTLENRTRGMALIGAAFGLGFTFGPLFGALALLGDPETPGPLPGYAAAGLSLVALLVAIFKLPESLNPSRKPERRSWMNFGSLRDALAIPSIGLLLLTSFVCVVAFGTFESVLSLLLKDEDVGFALNLQNVLLCFAYIGFMLALVQGVLVRRLSKRLSEAVLAGVGTLIMIGGLGLLARAQQLAADKQSSSFSILLLALFVCVCGFAFITPSLNSLISRRSDPSKQGGIMGLAQSVSSLARIVGPLVGIPLFYVQVNLPMAAGAGLLGVGLLCLLIAVPRGADFKAAETADAAKT